MTRLLLVVVVCFLLQITRNDTFQFDLNHGRLNVKALKLSPTSLIHRRSKKYIFMEFILNYKLK